MIKQSDALLSAAEMKAIEKRAFADGTVTPVQAMERAGQGVVAAIGAQWPGLAAMPQRAVVLCGPGNNGSDGFVVARLLARDGWDVAVFFHGVPERLAGASAQNYGAWAEIGPVLDAATINEVDELRNLSAALFVDAGFGIGLSRPLPDGLRPFATFSSDWRDPRRALTASVAVDLPSGISADSGRIMGFAFDVALCVTFHRAKRGHYLLSPSGGADGGAVRIGKLAVCDIGLEGAPAEALRMATAPSAAPMPGGIGKQGGHKYDNGHLLVLSAGPAKGGAARLSARGGLRVGAGLVTLGCPQAAMAENAAQLTAIMLAQINDEQALCRVLDQDPRINALCLGPGFAPDSRTRALTLAAGASNRALVLDAGALSAFADDPDQLFEALHSRVVLTPHRGEFARLFPDLAKAMQSDTDAEGLSKADAALRAAQRSGATVLLKGPDTIIAAPGGRCALSHGFRDRAAPWLATGGSGDVLAGFIAGLMARGMGGFDAATTGAHLLVDCALSFGPGLIAEDLPDELPKVMQMLAG